METSLRHTLGVPQGLLGHVQRGFGRQPCHRPSWRGMLWHQARKKRKTTNAIYVTDRQRMPLAMSTPISGSHNDLYNISEVLRELFSELKASGLSVSSLFLNVDAGFDSVKFWRICHQQEVFPNVAFNKQGECKGRTSLYERIYKGRYSIGRTNVWMDSYRSVLNMFDTTLASWGDGTISHLY